MKLLAVIVNYGEQQLNYLDRVVSELDSFKNFDVDIIIHSNIELQIFEQQYNNVRVKIIEGLDDWNKLPFTTRQTIFDRQEDYDLFLYTENDHLFTERHIEAFLEITEVLPDNLVAGHIQYEDYDGEYWYPAWHPDSRPNDPYRHNWEGGSPRKIDKYLIAEFTNKHQASFLLTKEQLNKVILHMGELNFLNDDIIRDGYNEKPRAGTTVYTSGGLTKVIPFYPDRKDFMIHHLPNIYREGVIANPEKGITERLPLGSDDNKMKQVIATMTEEVNNKEKNKVSKIKNLETYINQLHQTPSDINEHFPTIIKYGQECEHITEMGCRGICSTWGWLACAPEKGFISYDLYDPSRWGGDIQSVRDTAKEYNIKFDFVEADILKIDIEPTDLLFIDTWHCYDQLVAELKKHSDKVKKYICFHDTTTYAHRSEPSTSENSFPGGLTEGKGLWDAVTEFLEDNSDKWELVERFENNNGFTIIKRIGE